MFEAAGRTHPDLELPLLDLGQPEIGDGHLHSTLHQVAPVIPDRRELAHTLIGHASLAAFAIAESRRAGQPKVSVAVTLRD